MAIDYRFTSDRFLEQRDPDGSYSVHTLVGPEAALFDERVPPWDALVLAAQDRTGVPNEVTRAIMFGEGALPNARSFDNGLGLMQITDASLKKGYTDDEVLDPETNITIGTNYLKKLALMIDAYDPVQLASMFNCGPGGHGPKSMGTAPWGICEYTLPDGGQPYISKVVRAYNYALQHPASGGTIVSGRFSTAGKVLGGLLLVGIAAYAGVAIADPDLLPERLRRLPERARKALT